MEGISVRTNIQVPDIYNIFNILNILNRLRATFQPQVLLKYDTNKFEHF